MIDRLHCPQCRGPVYAPCGSHGERINCAGCAAELVTRCAIDNSVTVELAEHERLVDAIASLPEAPTEPPAGWQARVLAAIDKDDPT